MLYNTIRGSGPAIVDVQFLAHLMPLTPPSFSSFPPSFDSFPDVEDRSTRVASSASTQHRKESRDKDEAKDRKKKKRDRRDKYATQPSHERAPNFKADGYVLDDERIKAEESLSRTVKHQDVSRLVFFSDKKGDPLSVQYGGINSREVPKYHLVGRA